MIQSLHILRNDTGDIYAIKAKIFGTTPKKKIQESLQEVYPNYILGKKLPSKIQGELIYEVNPRNN